MSTKRNGNGHSVERDEAFDRWYQLHFERIRVLCSRIMRDASAAEDMAQEALLRAWVRRDQMREEDLGAWLSVVARNLCLSAMRRDGRVVVTDEVPERVDLTADPAAEVVRRESRRNVKRAMAKLGDRNRRVIYLRDVREAEYEEIGSEFGVSAQGARTIAFRARRVLREHLAAAGEGLGAWVFGIRMRVRTLRMRARGAAGSLDASAGPSMQAGLNLVLAIGVTVAAVAGPISSAGRGLAGSSLVKTISAQEASPAGDDTVLPDTPRGGTINPEGGSQKGGVSGGSSIPKPVLKGSPYHPSDGTSDLFIRYGPVWVSVPGGRGSSSDGLEPAFWALNTGLESSCLVLPAICEQLEYGFGGDGS